jgi:hypothetical protein
MYASLDSDELFLNGAFVRHTFTIPRLVHLRSFPQSAGNLMQALSIAAMMISRPVASGLSFIVVITLSFNHDVPGYFDAIVYGLIMENDMYEPLPRTF